jgi:hypothetical protein
LKNFRRHIWVGFLLALYCLVIAAVVGTSTTPAVYVKSGKSDQQYFSSGSSSFSHHTTPTESSFSAFHNFLSNAPKLVFGGNGLLARVIEQLFTSKYIQHSLSTRSILIEYRKADIIFPFHYFW